MSEEWKVQLSVKNKAGDLLNIRGQTAAEVAAIVAEIEEKAFSSGFFPRSSSEVTSNAVDTDVVKAQELVMKHLGPDQVEPASAAQVAYLVSLKVPEAEAKGLSKTDASARITALRGKK